MFVSYEQDQSTSAWRHGGSGATVARLTPDQKVGSSNLSALMLFVSHGFVLSSARVHVHLSAPEFSPMQNSHVGLKALV